jgi:glutathione S-transferase
LHKALYLPLLSKVAPAEVKSYAANLADARFAIVEEHLGGREFLLDTFSIADAYLFTVLNWTSATPLKLDANPAIQAYVARLATRPSIAKALGEELAMYKAEIAKQKAA